MQLGYGYCKKHKNDNLYVNWCKDHKHIKTNLMNGTIDHCASCQFWQSYKERRKTMAKRYRLYHGFDCNSTTGFNNGCYLDSIFDDENDARQFAEDFFILKGEWDNCDPDAYHVITGYYDKHGNTIEEEEYDDELGHSYSYQYISVEEENNDKSN